jgi:hypothetical protein
MGRWVSALVAMAIGLGAGGARAGEQNALPAFDLVSRAGATVASTALSRQGRWVLIYVSTACGSCDRLLSALDQWRPTLPQDRIVVVIRGARDAAEGYAKEHADAAGMEWYADADGQGARALGLQHEPALVAIENGRVAWTVTGVLNDPRAVEPIYQKLDSTLRSIAAI